MTYGLSFEDIIVRVAEATRTASFVAPNGNTDDNRAQIPTDPYRLDRCKRSVNDAMRWIVSQRRWNSLYRWEEMVIDGTGELPNAVNGASDRYWLPEEVTGPPLSAWVVVSTDGTYTTYVENMALETLSALALANRQTARPRISSVYPEKPAGDNGNAMQWQVRFWPKPNGSYTVGAQFRINQPSLVRLSDRHVFGPQFDDLVVNASIWKYKAIDSAEPEEVAAYKQMATESLMAAVALDNELTPMSLGYLRNTTGPQRPRISKTVLLNGVQIAP